MTLTINFVDNTEAAPKLMATCNLDVDTNEPDGIKAEYQQVIQEIHAETAAELLALHNRNCPEPASGISSALC